MVHKARDAHTRVDTMDRGNQINAYMYIQQQIADSRQQAAGLHTANMLLLGRRRFAVFFRMV